MPGEEMISILVPEELQGLECGTVEVGHSWDKNNPSWSLKSGSKFSVGGVVRGMRMTLTESFASLCFLRKTT